MNNLQDSHLPHVSIVMPAYNAARTLMEAVNSVLSQTYRDFELIICNDASTDETENILNNIKDDRVRVIHNPRNLGEGPTRDRAIELARGIWLAVIDADDTWAPERLEVMLREANASDDKMIFDDIIECHDTPSGMVPYHVLRGKHVFSCNGTEAIDVPTETWICSPRLLIKPLLPLIYVKQNNVRHSCKYGADAAFFLQLLSCGLRLRYLPKAMYYYRITQGSMTAWKNRYAMMQEVLENTISYFEHAPNVQDAVRKKISWAIRDGHNVEFFVALKSKEFSKALRIICQHPWIIPLFFRNLRKRMHYRVHRVWHGGCARGIR